MDFRSVLNNVKEMFVIGKANPYLHGRSEQQESQSGAGQESSAWQQPQAQPYGQPQAQPYGQPQQDVYQAQAYGQQPYAQGYAQPYQQPAAPCQQPVYQQPYAPEEPERPAYQTQINLNTTRQSQPRNRRSENPVLRQEENVVPFPAPREAQPEAAPMNAYVINVSNLLSARQAIACLRKGQCTLVVMDQLIDKNEIRRYVDMLTGACYALSGTMTRLSSKIGFYIMAPNTMTVYTDPHTSAANNPRAAMQMPVQQAQEAVPSFARQPGYPAGGMSFAQQPAYSVQPDAYAAQAPYAGQSAYQAPAYAAPGYSAYESTEGYESLAK